MAPTKRLGTPLLTRRATIHIRPQARTPIRTDQKMVS